MPIDRVEASTAAQSGIDPRALLIFREVGRRGSLTAAAQALGWTQPAVSQHVRRLEAALGVPLAVRSGRGIEITEAGRALLHHAEAVAASLSDAEREMSEYARARTGIVRVAAFPSASATIVADTVRNLAARHPWVDPRLTQLEPPEALRALAAAECDIAVIFTHHDTDLTRFDGFERTHLLDDPIRVVLPHGHPLHEHDDIDLAVLRNERWIGGCPSCRQHLLTSTADVGFTPDIRHSTDDYVVVQSLVASDLAVAMLPALALRAARNDRVTAHPLTGHQPRQVHALTRRNARYLPAIEHTLAALVRAARHPDNDH
ncbi:MAG: LysR family transcriptional regulator [Actinobacteria bacterium]|nr:LysR family transcriptional regulator [Actinomycetota bacterium]